MLTVFRSEIAPRATLLQSFVSGLWRRHGFRHRRAGWVTISPPPPACASHSPLTLHLNTSVGAAVAGAPTVGAFVAVGGTAETRMVASAGVL